MNLETISKVVRYGVLPLCAAVCVKRLFPVDLLPFPRTRILITVSITAVCSLICYTAGKLDLYLLASCCIANIHSFCRIFDCQLNGCVLVAVLVGCDGHSASLLTGYQTAAVHCRNLVTAGFECYAVRRVCRQLKLSALFQQLRFIVCCGELEFGLRGGRGLLRLRLLGGGCRGCGCGCLGCRCRHNRNNGWIRRAVDLYFNAIVQVAVGVAIRPLLFQRQLEHLGVHDHDGILRRVAVHTVVVLVSRLVAAGNVSLYDIVQVSVSACVRFVQAAPRVLPAVAAGKFCRFRKAFIIVCATFQLSPKRDIDCAV